MRAVRLAGILVALLLARVGAAAPPAGALPEFSEPASGWRPFRSEAGRFRVELPGLPNHAEQRRRTWGGTIEEHSYTIERDGFRWIVEHHDLPRLASLLSDDTLLNRAIKEFLNDRSAHAVRERPIRLQSYRGRALIFTQPDATDVIREARFYLVKSRLYVLIARAPRRPESRSALERFFGSFRLWTP